MVEPDFSDKNKALSVFIIIIITILDNCYYFGILE